MEKIITEKEVKTWIIEWNCPCGGIMEIDPNATVLLVNPPKYLHKCNECGQTEYSEESYPGSRLEYVEAKCTS